MNIDWFTVAAQAINFIVLLLLMKHFLFKPILNAIDKREKRITEELANAETKKNAAQKQKEEYDLKNADLTRQSAALLKTAQDEGHAEKLRLMEEAREAANALSEKRRQSLVAEETGLREALSRRTANEVLSITRKVLSDLAQTSLEEQAVGVFIRRLHDLDESKKKDLTSTLKKSPGPVTVLTALVLSTELRTSIEASIKDLFGTEPELEFETDSELISGIELGVNGQKVAWSIADYLSSIEEGFEDFLKANSR